MNVRFRVSSIPKFGVVLFLFVGGTAGVLFATKTVLLTPVLLTAG